MSTDKVKLPNYVGDLTPYPITTTPSSVSPDDCSLGNPKRSIPAARVEKDGRNRNPLSPAGGVPTPPAPLTQKEIF